MAINKKLIHFKTKENFDTEVANGNILDTSIVFIKDTKQIYTHGQLYDGSTFDPTDIEASIQNIIDNYATTETLNQAIQAVNSNINGVNQSINSTLQNVSEKANKADATATDALNLVEGIQGNLSSFALKSELPTKVSQLENDVLYVTEDVVNNGLYIYDIDGKFTLPENWNTANNSKAVGVAILTDDCRFVVAKEDVSSSYLRWGGYGTDISTLTNYTSDTDAATDFDGVNNTAKIIAAIGNTNDGYRDGTAAGDCAAYTFPNGKTGYLGAAGEWQVARQNKEDLNSALTLIGGTTMKESYYWTSTEYSSDNAWRQWFDSRSNLSSYGKNYNGRYVRAFLAIEVPKPLKERVSDLESNKQDNLVSGTNIKTINGESILGSGDIAISGSEGTSDIPVQTTTTSSQALTPNVYYKWTNAPTRLTITLETPSNTSIVNNYMFEFTASSSGCTLSVPSTIKWINGTAPSIEAGKTYQISIINNLATVAKFS